MLTKQYKDSFYKIFKLPNSYDIDKDMLKKEYHRLSRDIHPDLELSRTKSDFNDRTNGILSKIYNKICNFIPSNRLYNFTSSDLNKAYDTLKDDYQRAKLFTSPSSILDQKFLSECINLEEQINEGTDILDFLHKKIDECKNNYTSPESVAKWGYYKRLVEIAKQIKKN